MEALLKSLGPRLAGNLADKALLAAAAPIVEDAKRLAPVATGKLRDSIVAVTVSKAGLARTYAKRASASDAEANRTVLIGILQPTSRRAHLSEFGTVKSPAHPFLRPALDNGHDTAIAEMAKVLSEGIQKKIG